MAFKGTYFEQIVLLILGAILGQLLEFFVKEYKARRTRKKVRNRIEAKSNTAIENNKIASLDHADPTYEIHDIELNNLSKQFIIGFPIALREEMLQEKSDFTMRDDKSLDGTSSFSDIMKQTEIDNLLELIEKHRLLVGEEFIHKIRKNRTLFNGEKYGVYQIRRGRIDNDTEDASLRIDLFTTDYFTHRVMRSIFYELKKENHPIAAIKKIEGLYKYTPFLTSFGMNTLLILDDGGSRNVVLAERSKYITNTGEHIWHVSMNEGLTDTDIEGKEVSLRNCLHRGLREELGIREVHHKWTREEKFMDLFLELNNFEIGLTSYIEMQTNFSTINNLYSVAKDAELETNKLMVLPIKEKEITTFIKNNNVTNACAYTLSMYLARTL